MRNIEYHANILSDATVGNFRLLGFGTGSYYNKCHSCGIVYLGDKGSATCLACAIRIAEDCVQRCAEIDMNGDGLLDESEPKFKGSTQTDEAEERDYHGR